MKIYIGCGLTHVPREIFDSYVAYLHELAASIRAIPEVRSVRYALVDSDPQLALKSASDRAALCYDWDRRMVEESNLMIADASFSSTGLGIELQIAETAGIPIVMLVGDHGINRIASAKYQNPDHSQHELQVGEGIVSLMALGLPGIRKTIPYRSFSEAISRATAAVAVYS